MKKKIGLTGSTGSLEQNNIKKKIKNFVFKLFKDDIRDRKKVFKWVDKNNLEVVIHLAAVVPIKEVKKNPSKAKSINFIGTKNLVDACIKKRE